MAFLCDTNVLSEAMRPVPNQSVRKWLDSQEPVWISVITVEEIAFGLAAKDAQKQLVWFDSFLKVRCRILPVTATIAYEAGLLRGQLRRKGITRAQADLLIAATAQEHSLILATRNLRDFSETNIPLLDPFSTAG